MHEISVGFRESINRFSDDEAASIALRANTEYDALTEVERVRFLTLAGQYFLAWEEAFMQHEKGRLPGRNWQSIQKYVANGLGIPSLQRAWAVRKPLFDEDFVSYVDSLVLGEYLTQ